MKSAQPRGTSWKYDLFLGAWVLYAGYYACRRDIGSSANGSSSHVAIELACFGVTYAIGQFIGGTFADDASATKTALSGAFISVVCSLLQGWASPELGLALQLGNGLGQGLGWPALLKLIGQRFDSEERDRVLGWWSTSYILGGFLATVLVQWLAARANDLGVDPFHTIHLVPPAVLLIAAFFFAYKTRRLPPAPATQDASGTLKTSG
jgi:sugar phosphate permease